MSSKAFRVAGLVILTVIVVWALVLGWWQSNDHRPDTGELALYLLALPLALVGGYWLLRFSIDQIRTKPESETAAPGPATDDDPLALARAKTAAAEHAYSLQAVETFMVTAGGSSAEEILAAVDAGKRPEPVPELTDSAGCPVFAAMTADLDVAAVTEVFTNSPPDLQKLLEHDDALRALGLLDQVLQQACEAIRALAEPPSGRLRLRLLCLLPTGWGNSCFPGLQSWLRSFDWPLDKEDVLDVQLVLATSGVDALRQVDAAILDANREAESDPLLILVAGAMSATTQESVTGRETTVGLFSSQHQDRPIPGEGAVAILFASEATCARLKLPDCVTVSRVSLAVRDKSVHAGGRISGALIGELLAGLLDVSGVAAQDIKAALLDTDHRAVHVGEMLEGLSSPLAHLEPLKDCPATGTVTGWLEPLGGLFALACACHRARADQAPTLCLSNQHDRERAALLARPVVSASVS